jgi:hypothetical protein
MVCARHTVLLSVGQIGGALKGELPKRERTRQMIALARDFHVFASRVTTGLSAVLLSIRHIAQARYVRALLDLLIRHLGSVLSVSSSIPQQCDS